MRILVFLALAAAAHSAPPTSNAESRSNAINSYLDVSEWEAVRRERSSLMAMADAPAAKAPNVSDEKLRQASQNPIANLISLPFQNNTNIGIGPDDKTQNILNIQPVWPFQINENWNLITRTILPIVSQPGLDATTSSDLGLGDTTFSAFFSPAAASKLTWGVGPIVLIPTSTSRTLGAGEWGLGVSAVVVYVSKPWVVGAVVSNVWGVDGNVNSFVFQYFVNYNLPKGWYLASAPIITANWEAASSEQWTIPFGGGIGRVFRIGKLPVNVSLHYYHNVERPTGGPKGQVRFQIQLLFPK